MRSRLDPVSGMSPTSFLIALRGGGFGEKERRGVDKPSNVCAG